MVCKEASWIEGHEAKGTSKFWELRKVENSRHNWKTMNSANSTKAT